MAEIKTALNDLPEELVLDLQLTAYSRHPSEVPVPGPGTAGDPYSNIMNYLEKGPPQPATPMSTSTVDSVVDRRRKQFESQKANLFVSKIHLQSLLLADYANLVRCNNTNIDENTIYGLG